MKNNVPDIVYHYCSPEAFESIIKNKCLWLSDIKACNDFKEIHYTCDIFEKYIDSMDDEKTQKNYYRNLQEYKNNNDIYEINEELAKENLTIKSDNVSCLHFASFTTKINDLSQWISYGSNGEGYAIGFRTNSFPNQTYSFHNNNIIIKKLVDSIYFEKIEYSSLEQINILSTLFPEHQFMDYLDFIHTIKRVTPIFKSSSFSHENEWRLIHNPMKIIKGMDKLGHREEIQARNELYLSDKKKKKLTISEKCFRNTKHGLVSYYEYPIYNHSIQEVILGPKNKSDNDTICHFLTTNGYSHYKITDKNCTDNMFLNVYQSNISYR